MSGASCVGNRAAIRRLRRQVNSRSGGPPDAGTRVEQVRATLLRSGPVAGSQAAPRPGSLDRPAWRTEGSRDDVDRSSSRTGRPATR